MSIVRSDIDTVKAEALRLLSRIEELECMAGWTRYTKDGNQATQKPHPEDAFNGGQWAAAVKRASLDLSKALVEIRK